MSHTPARQAAAQAPKVPLLGARRIARQLTRENAAQAQELAQLRDVVKRFGIEDAVERTVALDDLKAEQAVQEARLRDLIEAARHAESGVGQAAWAQR
jgi:cell division septum initiation protein DivIVA